MNRHLRSRTGAVFGAVVETHPDVAALTVLSNDGRGWRSAHRAGATEHFGGSVTRTDVLRWVNSSGAPVVMSCWVKR